MALMHQQPHQANLERCAICLTAIAALTPAVSTLMFCNGCSGNHPGVSCPYEGNGAHAEPILGCYTAQALPNYKLAVVDTHVWVQHWS